MSQSWPWVKVMKRSSRTFPQTSMFFVPYIKGLSQKVLTWQGKVFAAMVLLCWLFVSFSFPKGVIVEEMKLLHDLHRIAILYKHRKHSYTVKYSKQNRLLWPAPIVKINSEPVNLKSGIINFYIHLYLDNYFFTHKCICTSGILWKHHIRSQLAKNILRKSDIQWGTDIKHR